MCLEAYIVWLTLSCGRVSSSTHRVPASLSPAVSSLFPSACLHACSSVRLRAYPRRFLRFCEHACTPALSPLPSSPASLACPRERASGVSSAPAWSAEGKPVPTELRREALEIRDQIDLEDEHTAGERGGEGRRWGVGWTGVYSDYNTPSPPQSTGVVGTFLSTPWGAAGRAQGRREERGGQLACFRVGQDGVSRGRGWWNRPFRVASKRAQEM